MSVSSISSTSAPQPSSYRDPDNNTKPAAITAAVVTPDTSDDASDSNDTDADQPPAPPPLPPGQGTRVNLLV